MENLQSELFEAAKQGSINSLHQLLKDDPLILDRAVASCFNETPLHVAAMLGHLQFVKEIIHLKPELVGELNSERSTPLHLASGKGHVEVVRVLLSVDGGACLARDRNEMTPLHLAAAKGRVEVVKVLLEAQPDAAYRGKSIIHLCVQRCQLEALEVLVRALGDQEAFINSVDADGNTALHLAVAGKQVETVKFLVRCAAVEVNAENNEGMTALDVLKGSRSDDVRDPEIENSLKHGRDTRVEKKKKKKKKEKERLPLKKHEKWLESTKTALMVVASLIATMAFQIGVNPPGGVWQDVKDGVEVGTSIFASQNRYGYENFYIINTIAFMASLSIILLLMSGFRFGWKFFTWILMVTTWIAISTIALCYVFVISALTPGSTSGENTFDSISGLIGFSIYVWLLLMALLLIIHTIRLMLKGFKKMRKTCCSSCIPRTTSPISV